MYILEDIYIFRCPAISALTSSIFSIFFFLLEIPRNFQSSLPHCSKRIQLLEPHWDSFLATEAEEPKDKEGRERRGI